MSPVSRPPVSVVLFDIGGVFLHPDSAAPASEFAASTAGVDGADVLDWYSDRLWEDYKRGFLSEEVFWSMRSRQLRGFGQFPWTDLRDRDERRVRLDSDMVALAGRLNPAVRRVALSNAGAELERRLRTFRLDGLFERVVNSHRVGMAKPEPEIYRYTARLLDTPAHQILFIDDKERNTEAARELGFRVWVHDGAARLEEELARLGLIA